MRQLTDTEMTELTDRVNRLVYVHPVSKKQLDHTNGQILSSDVGILTQLLRGRLLLPPEELCLM